MKTLSTISANDINILKDCWEGYRYEFMPLELCKKFHELVVLKKESKDSPRQLGYALRVDKIIGRYNKGIIQEVDSVLCTQKIRVEGEQKLQKVILDREQFLDHLQHGRISGLRLTELDGELYIVQRYINLRVHDMFK